MYALDLYDVVELTPQKRYNGFGGKVELGETPLEAAARELQVLPYNCYPAQANFMVGGGRNPSTTETRRHAPFRQRRRRSRVPD